MRFSKVQRRGLHICVTAEDLTAAQIREAADRWPSWIGSERSANALGLPESHTCGGLPVYPSPAEIHRAREYIARVISAHHSDSVKHSIDTEDSITNRPQDPAEVRAAQELADGE